MNIRVSKIANQPLGRAIAVLLMVAGTLSTPIPAQAEPPHVLDFTCLGLPGEPVGQFPNPLHLCPTADPGVWRVGNTWYVYSTGNNPREGAIPIRRSDDRKTWTNIRRMFPPGQHPKWADPEGHFWAPQVRPIGGRYVAYFAAQQNGRFKIGTATATRPDGVWEAQLEPLVAGSGFGVIDPYYFRDPQHPDKSYLLWKNDKNALIPPQPTEIMIQELSPEGLRLVGEPWPLMWNTKLWEGNIVEAPSMEYRNGRYYLFYSGNGFGSPGYAVGVARADSLKDNFNAGKYTGNPILERHPGTCEEGCEKKEGFDRPGGQDVIIGPEPDRDWIMFYHADPKFSVPTDADNPNERLLMMDIVQWQSDGWPRVNNGKPSF